jgi:ABC-type Zn uptake system ZnuABC Zn-binding protein ZnuA
MKNYYSSNRIGRILKFSYAGIYKILLFFLLTACGRSEFLDLDSNVKSSDKDLPCVVVSTTDISSIVKAIAGDYVEVHCFGKGNQDPHILNILPSHVKQMNEADLWIQVGSDIEAAWYPDLISKAQNPKILKGEVGFLDLSIGVYPLKGVVGEITRTQQQSGVHGEGNPHYLLDPIEGIRSGAAILKRLNVILPEKKGEMGRNYDIFRQELSEALIGKELAQRHGIIEVADHFMNGTLKPFLKEQKHGIPLGGWLGSLLQYRGSVVVGDHDLWPYLARRIGLSVLGYFEPEPGISPTIKHLSLLIDDMVTNNTSIIFSAPYFDKRHEKFISDKTSAKALPMCHQTGARPQSASYFEMVSHNLVTVIQALSK